KSHLPPSSVKRQFSQFKKGYQNVEDSQWCLKNTGTLEKSLSCRLDLVCSTLDRGNGAELCAVVQPRSNLQLEGSVIKVITTIGASEQKLKVPGILELNVLSDS
uniref:Uncharacterized protein n=1 Tax=Oryzias melastigma TaxID=30732 RepID=A0A3B3CCX3_ORYME